MNKYTYIVTEIEPADLQDELCSLGAEGWELINIIPIQRVRPAIGLDGQPQVKNSYQCVFKTDML